MALLLDPTIPCVWRDPHTLQFGVDRPVAVLNNLSGTDERLLAALRSGITLDALRVLARQTGSSHERVTELITQAAPALAQPTVGSAAHSRNRVVIDGAGLTRAHLVTLLDESGHTVDRYESTADPFTETRLALIIGAYALQPARYLGWLRRDIDHIGIVFSDTRVSVSTRVRPGRTPCLRCVDLARRDRDPAWPTLATQLHTAQNPGETHLISYSVAVFTTLLIATGDEEPSFPMREHRLSRTSHTWHDIPVTTHPECGCTMIPMNDSVTDGEERECPSGTVTAHASRARPKLHHNATS